MGIFEFNTIKSVFFFFFKHEGLVYIKSRIEGRLENSLKINLLSEQKMERGH